VAGDARQWLFFGRTGYAPLFQAIDTTRDARQAAPPVTLLSDAEAAALAQSFVDGEAIAFNVIAYSSYQVTVMRDGRVCAPASHPTLVAADGSVEVLPMTGSWTVAPATACE
jgi:hypothetical protein